MASLIHLDTHIAVWLAAGETQRLGQAARALIEDGDLALSPMALLELDYLAVIGRIGRPADEIVEHLRRSLGLTIADRRFSAVLAQARRQTWTRDPFDRLIVGHALASGAPLVTADRIIRLNVPEAVW